MLLCTATAYAILPSYPACIIWSTYYNMGPSRHIFGLLIIFTCVITSLGLNYSEREKQARQTALMKNELRKRVPSRRAVKLVSLLKMIKSKRERFLIISNHRELPPPPDVTHDGDGTHEEWEVEEILRSRWKDRKNKNEEYVVKWKGTEPSTTDAYGCPQTSCLKNSPGASSRTFLRIRIPYAPLLHTVRIVCN